MGNVQAMLIRIAILAGAIILGAFSGAWALHAWLGSQTTESVGEWVGSGEWLTNVMVGSTDADPLSRAFVAKFGLLGLSSEETIYFNAITDHEDRPLSGDCSYEIVGQDPAARWWSITLYGEDGFLLDNGDEAYSQDMTRISRDTDGEFHILVSPSAGGTPDWISSKGTETFALAMRMYNPNPAVVATPQEARLPEIRRISCQGGAA